MKILDIGLLDYIKSIYGLEPSIRMINSAIKNQNYFNNFDFYILQMIHIKVYYYLKNI